MHDVDPPHIRPFIREALDRRPLHVCDDFSDAAIKSRVDAARAHDA
jgi:hypothetical protein